MTQDRESAPGAVPGLDHPYGEEHLQQVLARVRKVMGNDWPRRAKLGGPPLGRPHRCSTRFLPLPGAQGLLVSGLASRPLRPPALTPALPHAPTVEQTCPTPPTDHTARSHPTSAG